MTQEQLTEIINTLVTESAQNSALSAHIQKAITGGQYNYSVPNLLLYCEERGIKLEIVDLATEDCFIVSQIADVHRVVLLLMDRYNSSPEMVYRKTGIHYSAPKVIDGSKSNKSLSIKTLLAICNTIHCTLLLTKIDDSSVCLT